MFWKLHEYRRNQLLAEHFTILPLYYVADHSHNIFNPVYSVTWEGRKKLRKKRSLTNTVQNPVECQHQQFLEFVDRCHFLYLSEKYSARRKRNLGNIWSCRTLWVTRFRTSCLEGALLLRLANMLNVQHTPESVSTLLWKWVNASELRTESSACSTSDLFIV